MNLPTLDSVRGIVRRYRAKGAHVVVVTNGGNVVSLHLLFARSANAQADNLMTETYRQAVAEGGRQSAIKYFPTTAKKGKK